MNDTKQTTLTKKGADRRTRMWATAAVLATALGWAGGAAAGPTIEQRSQGAKNQVAGKYAFCLHKAEKKLVLGGGMSEYTLARYKCEAKYLQKWNEAEEECLPFQTCPTSNDNLLVLGFVQRHVAALADWLSGGEMPGYMPATGQTLCYDAAGTGIPCAGTGQDGEVQWGAERSFSTQSLTHVIYDNVTGLVWEKLCLDGSINDAAALYTWAGAQAKIATLNTGPCFGWCDWRLPNVNELLSLADYSQTAEIDPAFDTPCSPGCALGTCSCTTGWYHWSSTTSVNWPDDAWIVKGAWTNIGAKDGSESYHVRAVRGGR